MGPEAMLAELAMEGSDAEEIPEPVPEPASGDEPDERFVTLRTAWEHTAPHPGAGSEAGMRSCGRSLVRRALTRKWSWREESNLQPAVYKTAALPIELRQPLWPVSDL